MIFPLLSLIAVIPFLPAISKQIEVNSAVHKLSLVGIIHFFKIRIVSYLFAFDSLPLRLSRYEIWIFLFLVTVIIIFSVKDRIKEFITTVSFKQKTTLPIVIVVIVFFIFECLYKFSYISGIETYSCSLPAISVHIYFFYLFNKEKEISNILVFSYKHFLYHCLHK